MTNEELTKAFLEAKGAHDQARLNSVAGPRAELERSIGAKIDIKKAEWETRDRVNLTVSLTTGGRRDGRVPTGTGAFQVGVALSVAQASPPTVRKAWNQAQTSLRLALNALAHLQDQMLSP